MKAVKWEWRFLFTDFFIGVYTAQVVKQQGSGQANALQLSSLLVYMALVSITLIAYLLW